VNGRSLGSKAVPKDSHVAWNVSYVPGAIEARGYKNDKVVLTARRETTAAPAQLVIRADRDHISADGGSRDAVGRGARLG
jgi:beta-galactosidase